MQWLTDIIVERVINEIGIPPVFIDRGDPAAPDFTEPNFTQDFAWHDLDLSGIVPDGAQGVLLGINVASLTVAKLIEFRKDGNSNTFNVSSIITQVASTAITADLSCPISSDRKLEYRVHTVLWHILNLTVKGWWL